MEKHDKHISFYNKIETDLKQTDDELWAKIEKQTINKPKTKILKLNWLKYAAAAVVLLLAGVSLFMKFQTKTIISNKGEHLSHILPDGSVIELNAETSLSYHAYWWRFKRELEFSGEAFFEVEKGKSFTVISNEGTTQVLGTSFNIYARDNDYKVFCKTGKVKVHSTKIDIQFEIQAGELAIIDNQKEAGSKSKVNGKNFVTWKDNRFNFINEPLQNVFAELERQFNVEIICNNKNVNEFEFVGNFQKPKTIEQALDLICPSFDIVYKKLNNNKYEISLK